MLCSHEAPTETVISALRHGKRAGARTVLNPAPFRGLSLEVLMRADIVTPNESELRESLLLNDSETPLTTAGGAVELTRRLCMESRPDSRSAVAVTMGERGVAVVVVGNAGLDVTQVAAPRVRAIDTIGAGDAFNGVLAAHLALGESVLAACRHAAAAGAMVATMLGARPSFGPGMPAMNSPSSTSKSV